MRTIQAVVALAILATTGCGLFDEHIKQMDLIQGMGAQAAKSLQSGAITSIHASGQGLNPGIVVEAAIVYRATARYDGLAGQFSIAQQGQSGPMSETDDETVNKIMRDKALRSEEVRHAIIDITGKVVGYEIGGKAYLATTQPAK